MKSLQMISARRTTNHLSEYIQDNNRSDKIASKQLID